jgi:hypothetical protein
LFENLKGRHHLEGLGLDGKIILKWILGRDGVDLIHLALARYQWLNPVYTVTNLQFS